MQEQYTVEFEVRGPSLPVDEILTATPLACEYECWKIGEAVTRARTAQTAGIRVLIAKRQAKNNAEEALARFLRDQARFLERLHARRAPDQEQFVRCIMCVYQDIASYLELSADAMTDLARTGTAFVVAAWPCGAEQVT